MKGEKDGKETDIRNGRWGPDGFIGDAHRRAIRLDGTAAIAAGVFSRNREKSLQMAESLGISPDRCYEDYQTMARAEGEREDGIDFVTVVTPNQSHYEICRAFLEAGIHVVCDKPVTTTYRQAKSWKPWQRIRDFCLWLPIPTWVM